MLFLILTDYIYIYVDIATSRPRNFHVLQIKCLRQTYLDSIRVNIYIYLFYAKDSLIYMTNNYNKCEKYTFDYELTQ